MKLSRFTEPEVSLLSTLESIDYQRNDPFPGQLEEIFSSYKDIVDSGVSQKVISSNDELKNKLEKLIKDRLGLSVVLVTDQYLAAVIPNLYTANSAVVRDAIRDEHVLLNTPITGAKALSRQVSGSNIGTVNAKTAKVSGWMADQPIPLYLNFKDLFTTTQLTISEAVAVCIHELGHAFSSIQYAYTINQANLIIKDTAESIANGRRGDVNYLYKELSKVDPTLTEDTVKGLLSDSPTVFGVAAFRSLMGMTASMSGSSVYDRSSSEAISDSFVVRFGYGEPLITGLDKLHSDPGYIFTVGFLSISNTAAFGSILYLLTGLLLGVTGVSLTIAGRIILTILGFMTLQALIYQNSFSTHDREYDDVISRYKRILRDMIGSLKNPELPKDVKKSILLQIETVEAVIARASNIPNILQKLLLLAFPSDRRAQRSLVSQQKIEEVLSNQIFKLAAKLDVKE